MTRRVKITWTVVLFALAVVGLLFPDRFPGVRGPYIRHKLSQQIRASDAEQRKQAAWNAIEYPSRDLIAVMLAGLLGREPEPNVREAYVYSLGIIGDLRNFAGIERTLDADSSGYVRCAAWLAAARMDPEHFRTLSAARGVPNNPWDRLGIAQARLSLGDARDLEVLFNEARKTDADRGLIASRALLKWLRPALDAVGRWPLRFENPEKLPWPAEWLDELEQRCASLDIADIVKDTHRQLAAAERVRRNIMRINGARAEILRFILGRETARHR